MNHSRAENAQAFSSALHLRIFTNVRIPLRDADKGRQSSLSTNIMNALWKFANAASRIDLRYSQPLLGEAHISRRTRCYVCADTTSWD
jgi:hypothetical protein